MSESVAPSTSRVAISVAFKRARRKFPRNFGLTSNAEEAYQSSEHDQHEDSSLESTTIQEQTESVKPHEIAVSDQLESSLVDSLETVEISDKAEILCDHCQHYPDKFERADLEVVSEMTINEKIENNCDPQLINVSNEFEKTRESSENKNQESYRAFQESNRSFSMTWKEESDHCDNLDSDVEAARTFEIPQKFYDRRGETTPSRRKRSHRCKKSSTRSSGRHATCNSHFASTNYAHEDDGLLHSPSCPYYNHCASHYCHHHQHCHRFCCCRSHCCCTRCCLNCQDQFSLTRMHEDPASSACRRSSVHRRLKRERCSTCKRRYSSPRKSADTCSRDSGIFTSVRYENDEEGEEEEEEGYDEVPMSSTLLEHQDSLPILQEKYNAGGSRYKRSERDKREDRVSTKSSRCERVHGSENEDNNDQRNLKNHKFCRRLLSR